MRPARAAGLALLRRIKIEAPGALEGGRFAIVLPFRTEPGENAQSKSPLSRRNPLTSAKMAQFLLVALGDNPWTGRWQREVAMLVTGIRPFGRLLRPAVARAAGHEQSLNAVRSRLAARLQARRASGELDHQPVALHHVLSLGDHPVAGERHGIGAQIVDAGIAGCLL